MASKVPMMTAKELESLHIGTLMSRRKALLKCEESFNPSDRVGGETAPDPIQTGLIEYKDTEAWRAAYTELKAQLATRENMPNKAERKAMRQAKAR